MRARRPVLGLAVAVAALSLVDASGRLELHRNLPRDPMLVFGVSTSDPASDFEALAKLFERFVPLGEDAAARSEAFAELARALRSEVLPRLGPQVVVAVDLPPIDHILIELQSSRSEGLEAILGGTGLVAEVADASALDTALARFFAARGAEVVRSSASLSEARWPLGGQNENAASLSVHYEMRGGRLALGFSPSWVRSALERRPSGQRLVDGEDYKRVFGGLDPHPTDMVYVNLPKLHDYVLRSQVARLVLESNEEMRSSIARLTAANALAVGLGSTSVVLPQGVRTKNFGPSWMSGTAVATGFLAAQMAPGLLGADDSGKSRRTMTDVQAIAKACEGFSTDSRGYPGPTEGWVPVERIAAYLEPVYIGELPRIDAWHNPILYWSDGGSYRVVSTGRDGRMDRDWTDEVDPMASAGHDGDIVIGDSGPLAWPGGPNEK
jgi:hypothetical protein